MQFRQVLHSTLTCRLLFLVGICVFTGCSKETIENVDLTSTNLDSHPVQENASEISFYCTSNGNCLDEGEAKLIVVTQSKSVAPDETVNLPHSLAIPPLNSLHAQSDNLAGVDRSAVAEYLDFLKKHPSPATKKTSSKKRPAKSDKCDLRSLRISGMNFDQPADLFSKGSNSELYMYERHGGPEKLVVKVLTNRATENTFKTLEREKAFLSIFSKLPEFAKIFSVDWDKSVAATCRSKVMVSSVEGDTELGEAAINSSIGPIAARAIELVQLVHEHGFVHGDIHIRQFLLTKNELSSLRLIDFGRAMPYLTSSGNHIPNTETHSGENWNPILLSIWEMENLPKTRRDDMFRLAEMFLKLLPDKDSAFSAILSNAKKKYPKSKAKQRQVVTQLKRDRNFSPPVPKLFSDFYTYTLGLSHDQRPDYEPWIGAFRAYQPGGEEPKKKSQHTSKKKKR